MIGALWSIMDIQELRREMEKKLTSRKVREDYRLALRGNSFFLHETIDRIGNLLEYDLLSWLIERGYKPEDSNSFLEIITAEFDVGNEVGIGASIHAVMEDDTKPVNLRMILCLLKKMKMLKAEIAYRDGVILALREQLEPSIFTRAVGWLRSKLVNNTKIDEE